MGTMTVRENLAFSAALRLPSNLSNADRQKRVDLTIEDLGLYNCADTRVSSFRFLFIFYLVWQPC